MDSSLFPSTSHVEIFSSTSTSSRACTSSSYELMHQQLLKSLQSYAIVLSLLLTSSYCGFLQIPNSLDASRPSNSSNFLNIFIYSNGFSFFSSVAGLLLFASSSFSPLLALDFAALGNAEKEVEHRITLLAHTLPTFFYVILFLQMSLTSLVFAYIFAGLLTVRSAITEQLAVIVPAVIGGFIFLQAIWVCAHNSYQLLQGSIRKNQKLWDALKKGTWFGLCLTNYVDFFCGDASMKNQHQNTASERENSLPSS